MTVLRKKTLRQVRIRQRFIDNQSCRDASGGVFRSADLARIPPHVLAHGFSGLVPLPLVPQFVAGGSRGGMARNLVSGRRPQDANAPASPPTARGAHRSPSSAERLGAHKT